MATVKTTDFIRRSMIYHVLNSYGAVFEPIGESAIASHFGDVAAETEQAKTMAIADLSPLPRTGFKGPDTPDWLKEQGVDIPGAPNRAVTRGAGMIIGALSWDEHLILSSLSGDNGLCAKLNDGWRIDDGKRCYLMPRADSHAWFALSGAHAAEMFAKVCGVDLRPQKFENGAIAQTSLARLNAVIIRNDLGSTLAFFVLADSASAEYLWACLLDAMVEFDGALVGIAALRNVAGE